uniref:Hyaluronidase n=1 Tax=Parastrongyloides trichosuri TaxID=131310 RepID=A0A0N4ZKW9_PARTI
MIRKSNVLKALVLLINIFLKIKYAKGTLFYWNIPTNKCLKNGINILPKQYGMIVNRNETFYGKKIVLFYEKDVGLYPYYIKVNASYYKEVNGGLPQNVNYPAHFIKLRESIKRIIPRKHYNGLAIIDIEAWRVKFDTNWGDQRIYINKSIEREKVLNKSLTYQEARKLAEKNFNKAASKFFTETIDECKKMRPNATWGFYDLTLCNEKGGVKGKYCFTKHNNKLLSVFKHADAIFPSPYLYQGKNYSVKEEFVKTALQEAQRLVHRLKKKYNVTRKIYVYNKFEIDPYNKNVTDIEFYDPYYLCITYWRSVEFNVDGVITWSSTKNLSERCPFIRNYTKRVFGPYIRELHNITNWFHNKLIEGKYKRISRSNKELDICKSLLTYDNIKMWCDTNFYGPNCLERKLNSSGIINNTISSFPN